MRNDSLEIFYRALFTPVHHRRWRQRQFTSSHNSPPPDWDLRFQETGGSLNEAHYDRINTLFGEMTLRALQTFLELKRRGVDARTTEEKFAIGELPGVCAYRTARQVLDAYPPELDDPILRFVAFRGRYIGPCTPEAAKGAVTATVEGFLCSPLTHSEFASRFG